MKHLIRAAIIPALVFGLSAGAGGFKAPDIPGGEVRVYKTYYATEDDRPQEGDPLTKDLAKFTPVTYTGEVDWEGGGKGRKLVYTRTSQLANGGINTMKVLFETEPELKMISCENLIEAPDGTRLAEEYYDLTNPILRYPEDTFHVMVGNMVLRGSDLSVGKQVTFNVWLSSTMIYPFRYEVIDEETITTEAGVFDCYKVEGTLVPQSLTDITGILIGMATGKYYFWVEKGGSHGFVRLLWPISSGLIPGRYKYQTQDLVEIRQGK